MNVGKIAKVIGGVLVVGIAIVILLNLRETDNAPSTVVDVPSLGKVVKQTTNKDCNTTVSVTLNTGERMVHGGYCKILSENVVDGAITFYYDDGSKQTVRAGGKILKKSSALMYIVGASNTPAKYVGNTGKYGQN